jgi:hypothetical protein
VTTELKSMFSWIKILVSAQPAVETSEAGVTSVLDFDPAWHGDHWQNLLSSPMDARRYVMEDWSVASAPAFDNTGAADESTLIDAEDEPELAY